MAPSKITDDDLQAYVDGALPLERRQVVEAGLADDPVAAERIAAYLEQNELLHRLYDPLLEEALPAQIQQSTTSRRGRWLPQVAAACLLLLIGGLAGWLLRDLAPFQASKPEQDFARRAAAAFAVFSPEVRHPVEVSAAEERHLVAWLSKRLKAPLKAPNLAPAGFNLVGGRLLSGKVGPAGLFMYEDGAGQRLTLYVQRQAVPVGNTSFRYEHKDGIGVFYWVDSQLSYALAGRLKRPALLTLSRTVYEQLEK